jgi:signal transduction histidine kinase
MPIRWRLTLWFSLILCAVLVVCGVSFHTLLQRSLRNDVDDNLKIHSANVQRTLNLEDIPAPIDYDTGCGCLPSVDEFVSPGIYVQLIDRNGNIVGKSHNLGEQELPVDRSLMERGFGGETSIETIDAGDGAKVRVMASPLYLQHQTLLLEVGQSLQHIDDIMSQIDWALLAGILLAVALAGISGGVLVRRALSPVEAITRTAESIESSSDLSQRVGYSGPQDEIGQLAATFDRMIDHLDRVFQSQRHFVADASHELRSPLTVLQGNLDLLKRNLGEEDRRESLRAIEAETQRMGRIVKDLLLLAEVESGPIERRKVVSLGEILLEGLERGRQLTGNRNIILGRHEELSVRGDYYGLMQLLANLIDNAIRYTPEGGAITLSLYRDGDWARLEVADTGMGIAPEHLPHVFDRFYQVDKGRSRADGGSGLGLAIVKAIAEQHQGKVTVTSEPGKGSTFTVWLKL